MGNIFLYLVNISFSASWLVLIVLVFRYLFRRAPANISCCLWALVGLRLAVPVRIYSPLSLLPPEQPVPDRLLASGSSAVDSGLGLLDDALNSGLGIDLGKWPSIAQIAAFFWLAVAAAMLARAYLSYSRLRRQLADAVPAGEGIYRSAKVDTPFVLGLVHPLIYLPEGLEGEAADIVIRHERAHIRRRDNWWMLVGYILRAVYWFNPLIWLAYSRFRRDIEAACDESVIRGMDKEQRRAYSTALLELSIEDGKPLACPPAFGELGVRQRIERVMDFKKPTRWFVAVAAAAAVLAGVCFATAPAHMDAGMQSCIDEAILEYNYSASQSPERFCTQNWIALGSESRGACTTVYTWVYYGEYECDGKLELRRASHVATAITVERTEEGYELVEYWEPRDGSYLFSDIRAKFPLRLWFAAMDSQAYVSRQSRACESQARDYYGL